MAEAAQPASNERTPLLHEEPAVGQNNEAVEGQDAAQMNQQVKSWKRQRWISFICSAILIVAFVLILVLSGVLSRGSGKYRNAAALCLTPACVHAASEVLYNLSPDYQEMDACTTFDHMVCDGFNARHDIPSDASGYSTASLMSENGKIQLRHILESSYPNASQHSTFSPLNLATMAESQDEDNFNKMKTAYESCMNEAALQEIGIQPLLTLVGQVVKQFPLVTSTDQSTLMAKDEVANLSEVILFLYKLGVTTFAGLGTGADDKNPEVVIIQASPAGISLPSPEYYQDEATVQKYQDTVEAVLKGFISAKVPGSGADKLAKAVVDLEKKIAAITPPPEDQQDVTKYYNIVKVQEAAAIGPAIRLDEVVKGLVPSDYKVDTMLLAFPEFLGNVSQIVSAASRETIQSYLVWKTVATFASYVEGLEVEPLKEFRNILGGKDAKAKTERWKTCLSYVDGTIGWVLSRFFVEAAFSEDAKKFGDQIINDIKQQFIHKLHGLDWMDEEVKQLAVNKVNGIDQKIGYPTSSPDIMNPQALKDWYAGLVISDSFFNNTVSSNAYDTKQTWSDLGKPVDHGRWLMQADIVNAYYNPVGAEIVFPAGIMQFPVFDYDLPSYVSYGAFASVAGHELTHAFDSAGRHYDEHGNYTDWWTEHTVEEFSKRADCFVKQYGDFTVDGPKGEPLHVNGKLTLGENIADAGGVAAAFAAWKERQVETPDKNLPGLEYFSQEQLFFVFYANWWCGKMRKEQALERIYTDPHSPAWARILGTMANSRDFREAFSCPVKQPTCELW